MSEKNKKPETENGNDPKWSTSAKVGAAVGSAALVAALIYASKKKRNLAAPEKAPPSVVRDDD